MKCYTANDLEVTDPPTGVVVVTVARTGVKQSVGGLNVSWQLLFGLELKLFELDATYNLLIVVDNGFLYFCLSAEARFLRPACCCTVTYFRAFYRRPLVTGDLTYGSQANFRFIVHTGCRCNNVAAQHANCTLLQSWGDI